MPTLDSLIAKGLLAEDVPIGRLTTYKLGGASRLFAEVVDLETLTTVAGAARAEDMPILVIGRGSNLLISDHGFEGLTLRLGGSFTNIEVLGATVVAGGAVGLPQLARQAARAGRGGLEWCVGVPGSVGGAVAMNAGCFGTETVDVLLDATILELPTGDVGVRGPSMLAMEYRTSALTSQDLVLTARFHTEVTETEEAEARMREITRWRRDNQPGGTFNAGSVFKNPPGDAAGRLIDASGLKGTQQGDVSVSGRHANFFVAGPGACAQDVYELVKIVQTRVLASTGILLEPELRMVGDFESSETGVVA
ncbi:MAG TPA: UDP-N-acetylmuramate dehydrogenase [Actinobacteria bacterium]|nr:UDP-N-acetylmuramate dehydrogenase [Actinomycetota bacterium]